MDELEKELIRKSEIVFEVKANHDFKPTIQSKSKILDLIRIENYEFYKKLLTNESKVFVYGDKFFAPNKDVLLCIPAKATNTDLAELILLNKSNESILEIVKAYKAMAKKHCFNDYFEIG